MDHIDTHDIELAFDDLITELNKLKNLNDLVDAYKNNIDLMSKKTNNLVNQIEVFYNNAKEHDDKVNALYSKYVDGTKQIQDFLTKESKYLYTFKRRNIRINTAILTFTVLNFICLLFHLIFA